MKLFNAYLKHVVIAIAITFSFKFALSQSIWTNPITGTNPSSSNPYTTGQTVDPNITVSGIGIGTGVTANVGNDRYNTSSWNTTSLDPTAYFEFSLTPSIGCEINFVSFVYTAQRSNTSIANFAFRSSLDGFTTDIGTPTFSGTTIDLSAGSFQNISTSITFRFYAWGAGSTSNTFSINDFTFNGTTSCVGSITTGAVSNAPFTVSCTAGDNTGTIAYTSTGTFNPGNTFTVEMSDEFGDFSNPIIVGSIADDGLDPNGNINLSIPVGTDSGTGYRFRIVSSDPTLIGTDNGVDIAITNSDGVCVTLGQCAQIIQFQLDPLTGNNGTLNNTGEFIQICNTCNVSIDISCYVLCFTEDNGTSRRGDCIRIPDNTSLAAGECYLMGGNGTIQSIDVNADWNTTLDLNWHTCGCVTDVDGVSPGEYVGVLSDGGEDITLFDENGNVHSAITFEEGGGANYSESVNIGAGSGCSALNVTIPPSSSHQNVGSNPDPTGPAQYDEGYLFDCLTETWGFADATTGGSYTDLNPDMTYDCALVTPLPVELIEFFGYSKNGLNNLIWSTASEHATDYFTIERSLNGEEWRLVGVVNASGFSETTQTYGISDPEYLPELNYYRLSTIDLDGTVNLESKIVVLDNSISVNGALIGIYNTLGQEIKGDEQGVQIYLYEDGTTKRIYKD